MIPDVHVLMGNDPRCSHADSNNVHLQVLSDGERRRNYDQFGDVGDSQGVDQQRGGHHGQGFTVFQSGNFFHFQFVPPGPQHRSDGATEESFLNHILPDSERKPHLLYFYHDWCFQCAEVHHQWEGMKDVSGRRCWRVGE